MNEVVRYLTPAAQTEFKNEWIDALIGAMPQSGGHREMDQAA